MSPADTRDLDALIEELRRDEQTLRARGTEAAIASAEIVRERRRVLESRGGAL